MNRDLLWLTYIEECLTRIRRYTTGGRSAFMGDALTQDAVLRNIQVLAEAAYRTSDELRSRHADMDWYALHGLRNLIVHESLSLDLGAVWEIVEYDLPELEAAIGDMLRWAREG
jgi:uncharacterized protein with HEPN domain